ncbi:Stp1/IreP family PP2C-type Ser/Thr phosphatase [Merismopedia glauca]|uniref:Stp1/IreP family PP2C-type Ser/Thr phosphatase n=1 Tax=Merismopedia glauca CCAP 1448/3 TaxID=1296344 RepID=A0A2T1C309_9CYAN|nr:Stp1/IreP family PP2C-type Ser/Thr phosphatase [Merismopedia glauca]PSB02568.1 Stp1/IreP family PP2C-type Ser/Thr phosphatase [Merismopedia glauca CCAP 1448/3]
MKLSFTSLSDTGVVRAVNQDACYADSPQARFFIVADGMGGHVGGQEASRIAKETVCSVLDKYWNSNETSQTLLAKALVEANEAIVTDQFQHPERADMGTTAVVLMFRDRTDSAWYTHVGDSRLYLLRDGQLQQVTQDHTWVSMAVKIGDLTQEQARNHPYRHVLSQCLGRKDLSQIEVQPIEIKSGDRLLLCSDGLTEELPDAEICRYLSSDGSCEDIATALVNAAKANGGRDNITVVIVEIDAFQPGSGFSSQSTLD